MVAQLVTSTISLPELFSVVVCLSQALIHLSDVYNFF